MSRALPLRAPAPTPARGRPCPPDQAVEVRAANIESQRLVEPSPDSPRPRLRYLPNQTVELGLADVASQHLVEQHLVEQHCVDSPPRPPRYLPNQTVELGLADVASHHLVEQHLVERHLVEQHCVEQHCVDSPRRPPRYPPNQTVELGLTDVASQHLVEQHLVEQHLVEQHLVEQHCVDSPRRPPRYLPNQTVELDLADVASQHLVEQHLVEQHCVDSPRRPPRYLPNQTVELGLADVASQHLVERHLVERPVASPRRPPRYLPQQTIELALTDIDSTYSRDALRFPHCSLSSTSNAEPPMSSFDPRETLALPTDERAAPPRDVPPIDPRDTRALPARVPLDRAGAPSSRQPQATSPLETSPRRRQRLPVAPPFIAAPVDELRHALVAIEASHRREYEHGRGRANTNERDEGDRAVDVPAKHPSRVPTSHPSRVPVGKLAPCDLCTRVIPHRAALPTPETPVVRRFHFATHGMKSSAPYRHACPPAKTSPLFAAMLFVLLAVASCVVTLASGVARADGATRESGVARTDATTRASGAARVADTDVPGPPIHDVLEAAYRAAGLDKDLGHTFATRARLAALVPWLSVRTARDTSWRDEETDVARGTTLEVRATWRLDRLVFEGRELQVVSIDAARRRERRRLGQKVIRAYFMWKRAVRAVESGAVDPDEAMTRAAEAEAELDDLTGEWFTEQLDGGQRSGK